MEQSRNYSRLLPNFLPNIVSSTQYTPPPLRRIPPHHEPTPCPRNPTTTTMPIWNRNKKKLEAVQQQLDNALVESKRKEAALAEEHRRHLDASYRAQESQRLALEAAHARQLEDERCRIEEARRQAAAAQLAREELERQEQKRLAAERELARAERARLDREARARKEKQKKMREASPETLRSLRELIRTKYQLDVEIWRLRNARRPDRWIVEGKMERADAVVQEIMAMVRCWENQVDGSWDDDEWERVQEIRDRLVNGGVRIWAEKPLWTDSEVGGSVSGKGVAGRRTSRVGRRVTMTGRSEAPDRKY